MTFPRRRTRERWWQWVMVAAVVVVVAVVVVMAIKSMSMVMIVAKVMVKGMVILVKLVAAVLAAVLQPAWEVAAKRASAASRAQLAKKQVPMVHQAQPTARSRRSVHTTARRTIPAEMALRASRRNTTLDSDHNHTTRARASCSKQRRPGCASLRQGDARRWA